MPYDYKPFDYIRPLGLDQQEPRHKVLIVGAGPIGLAAALELAAHGVPSVVLDDNNVVSVGSRAICWSKRSLEILDRLGIGGKAVDKGVTWKLGRTFHGAREVFNFDLQPEAGHKMPAFVNLQQYYVEQYLVEACMDEPLVELRFKNRVTGITQTDHVRAEIETPDGPYTLEAQFLLACDGARSPIRQMMGLDFEGVLFEEKFLIADIHMHRDFPSERWFWFEPEFHEGQSALLHKQPDNIYRIDLQLGWDADTEEEKKPERIIPRIEKVVGQSAFELDWTSIYTFQCRRLSQFVHDRVIFVGDSAHIVSPFGARGGNGGLQDVDALGWRLAAVVEGRAPVALLDRYDIERQHGADENIANSSRATKFMSPDAGAERLFRDATLALASKADFARPMVNSGRLSVPCVYPLAGAPDAEGLPFVSRPGAVAPDAPLAAKPSSNAVVGHSIEPSSSEAIGHSIEPSSSEAVGSEQHRWLSEALGGRMVLLCVNTPAPDGIGIEALAPKPEEGVLAERYGAKGLYLIRPDQVVAARWTQATAQDVMAQVAAIWEGKA
jgi:3-(3-hydroxy-phenyl)propionate hydroxylase